MHLIWMTKISLLGGFFAEHDNQTALPDRYREKYTTMHMSKGKCSLRDNSVSYTMSVKSWRSAPLIKLRAHCSTPGMKVVEREFDEHNEEKQLKGPTVIMCINRSLVCVSTDHLFCSFGATCIIVPAIMSVSLSTNYCYQAINCPVFNGTSEHLSQMLKL